MNLRQEEFNHMRALMDAVGPYMEGSISSVHDYGMRAGGGLVALKEWYCSNVKGFDINNDHGKYDNYGDIHNPREDADLICCLQVFEASYNIDTAKALNALAAHCKYLAISVLPHVSILHKESPEVFWQRLIYIGYANVECAHSSVHLQYLFKGDL